MVPNKCCGTIFVHWFRQVHYSITASKENVVVFFQFEYAEFSGCVHFFRFRPQLPFLCKCCPKNQYCQFILKFGTWTNSDMQNSMVMLNFSAFHWNCLELIGTMPSVFILVPLLLTLNIFHTLF